MSRLDVTPVEARSVHVALASLAAATGQPLWTLEGALATLVLNARIREAGDERKGGR